MEEEKFKKLIQKVSLDEPGLSFTDDVMNMIESQEELSLNPVLLPVLNNELLTDPSVAFADNIMLHIQPKVTEGSAAIIPKKGKLIILVIAVSVFLLAVMNARFKHVQNVSLPTSTLNLSGATTGIIKMATTVLPYLIPFSILLFLDYFFRTKQKQSGYL